MRKDCKNYGSCFCADFDDCRECPAFAMIYEHSIIMNKELIPAILAGTKKQTRRVITPQPETRIWREQFPSGVWGWKQIEAMNMEARLRITAGMETPAIDCG